MSNRTVSNGKVLLHVSLVFLTGGLWFVWLLVRFLLTKS